MEKTFKVAAKRTKKKYDGFSLDIQKNGKFPLLTTSNVVLEDGGLRCGIGLEKMYNNNWDEIVYDMTQSHVDSVFYLWDRLSGGNGTKVLGYLTETGVFYVYDETQGQFVKKHSFACPMKMVSTIRREKGKAYYCSMLFGYNGFYMYSTLEGLVQLSSRSLKPMGCFCGGRAFYTVDGHTVLYSALYEPEKITLALDQGGSFTIPSEYGILTGMETLFDRVYLFFEQEICYVDVRGDARDMRVEKVAYGGGKIAGKTVKDLSVGGKRAFFMAEDGIYVLNGERVWRVAKNLDLQIGSVAESKSATFENSYFVTYTGKDGLRYAVAVDAESEEGFFSVPFLGLCSYAREAFCAVDGAWHKVTYNGDLPAWAAYEAYSGWTDFDMNGRKTLEQIELFGEGSCTVTVQSDEKEKSWDCTFVDGRCVLDTALRGKRFALRFILKKGCKLKGLETTVQRLQGKFA